MNIPPFFILLTIIFAALSLFFAWYGLKFFFKAMKMFRDDTSTTAVVTQIVSEPRTRKGRTWMERSAVLSFETFAHEKREIKYSGAFGGLKLQVGDTIKIWYHESEPEVFTLGGRYFLWDMLSMLLITVCFGLPSWTLIIYQIKLYLNR